MRGRIEHGSTWRQCAAAWLLVVVPEAALADRWGEADWGQLVWAPEPSFQTLAMSAVIVIGALRWSARRRRRRVG